MSAVAQGPAAEHVENAESDRVGLHSQHRCLMVGPLVGPSGATVQTVVAQRAGSSHAHQMLGRRS